MAKALEACQGKQTNKQINVSDGSDGRSGVRVRACDTSMDTEYSVVNHDGERQEVEHVCEICPYMR